MPAEPDEPIRVSVTPDVGRFAAVLRIFARHILAAADDIETLNTSPDGD